MAGLTFERPFRAWIGNQAVSDGLLERKPNFAYNESPTIEGDIIEILWGMILEGIYVPGSSLQNPGLTTLRLTEYGRKCFEAGELTPHDPDDYLRRLNGASPNLDTTTLLYVEEALGSFRAGRFLAAAVMIGVASESMLERLAARGATSFSNSLPPKAPSLAEPKPSGTYRERVIARL